MRKIASVSACFFSFFFFLSSLASAGQVGRSGQVKFTSPPSARKDGGRIIIKFAVSLETDVAVYIEDSAGKAVRHLAAGVLGAKAPKPFKPGLSQSLEWDGKDDYGKPVLSGVEGKAVGGPYKVRVALGLKPTLDKFLLGNPRSTGRIDALAVGPEGKIYVFHKNEGLVHWWSHNIKILDRDGKHHKVIWPYTAEIDPKRIKPLAPHLSKDGHLVPRIYQALKFSFYPEYTVLGVGRQGGSQSPVVDKDGRVYWMSRGLRLGCLDADGGVPYDSFLGPKLLSEVKGLTGNGISLAVSSDGKHIYFAGLSTKKGKIVTGHPCVYRLDIKTRGPATVFVGKPGSPGKEKELLNAPRGLAVANGHLYVGDPDADRVVVFKEGGGAYVGEIKVKSPHSIAVDPGNGAVYVASYTSIRTAELIKFDGYKNAKALYKTALPRTGLNPNPGACRIALDTSSKPLRIWVPSTGNWGQKEATHIDDTGKAFVSKKLPRDGGGFYRDLTYDHRRDELYVRHGGWLRIDGKNDKVKKTLKIKNGIGAQLVPAPDGSLVTLGSWGGGVCRHDRDGKPLNWPGQETSKFPYHGIMNFMERVLAVKSLDEIYVILPPKYLTNRKKFAVTGGTRNTVDVLGSDGKPKRTAVWQCTHGAVLRVDHKGNVYVADMVTPPGRSFPEFFDGKITGKGADRQWLSYLYGSIVKFPPSGGAIWYGKQKGDSSSCVGKPSEKFLAQPTIKVGAHNRLRTGGKAELQGAQWYRFGFAPYGIHTGSSTCSCEGAGFDVDMFGRVFYPNVGQFRVEVVDAANNMIGTFGKYGNQDDGQAGGAKSYIPLAWPLTVATSDTHAYVADSLNRRIVKVRLGYAVEATCAVR